MSDLSLVRRREKCNCDKERIEERTSGHVRRSMTSFGYRRHVGRYCTLCGGTVVRNRGDLSLRMRGSGVKVIKYRLFYLWTFTP